MCPLRCGSCVPFCALEIPSGRTALPKPAVSAADGISMEALIYACHGKQMAGCVGLYSKKNLFLPVVGTMIQG